MIYLSDIADTTGIVQMKVRRLYLHDGRPVCDLVDPLTGTVFTGVDILVGGGGKDNLVYVPPALAHDSGFLPSKSGAGQAVVVVDNGAPSYVIGFSPRGKLPKFEDEPDDQPDSSSDRTHGPTQNDLVIVWHGTKIFVASDGSITINMSDSSTAAVRVQLPGGGVFRVSKDGDASDAVAVASSVQANIDSLKTRISALETWATALTVNTNSGVPNTIFAKNDPNNYPSIASKVVKIPPDAE